MACIARHARRPAARVFERAATMRAVLGPCAAERRRKRVRAPAKHAMLNGARGHFADPGATRRQSARASLSAAYGLPRRAQTPWKWPPAVDMAAVAVRWGAEGGRSAAQRVFGAARLAGAERGVSRRRSPRRRARDAIEAGNGRAGPPASLRIASIAHSPFTAIARSRAAGAALPGAEPRRRPVSASTSA
ncbi:hypothetical protein ISI15_21905 [Burkholderia pseudomallei]|nr:hypothetical protein [Burkholderia pseudomallei]